MKTSTFLRVTKKGKKPRILRPNTDYTITRKTMKEKETALVPTELGAKDLAAVMAGEAEKRTLITQYITKHMKEGADYGSIRIGGRDSKPSLFKPGSEKFLSLFKLTAKFEKDTDTWEMAGSKEGVFAYKCSLVASNGNVVGEGRGAATMQEKQWSLNTCIKIAEKRAQIDAVLRTGALSDFFTQDLEDMQPEAPERPKMAPYRVEKKEPKEYDEHAVMTPEEVEMLDKDLIKGYMKDLGHVPTPRAVKIETGLEMIPANYKEITKVLREKIESKDPIPTIE